jgi:23S rRNA (adenine2503-C2)-methyltransferase
VSDEKRLSLSDFSAEELKEVIGGEYPPFRAEQIFIAVHQYKTYDQMSNIPKNLRGFLAGKYDDISVKILETHTGKDDAEKYLFLLNDGNIVEGVFMPHKYGDTLCISTQVGCRMGCGFCASTLNGLIRNLTAGEMLGQVLSVNAKHGGTLKERAVTNVVLMGSGEPLDNYDEVTKFLRLVSAPKGICISLRNISLSTCGVADKIKLLADSGLAVTLTISLHASDDEERAKLMPIENKWKIADVLDAANYYFDKTGRRIIFEYSLIEGENCSREEAEKLARLVRGMNCHINLIKLNFVKERGLKGADNGSVKDFMDTLTLRGISNTLRRSMGNDIGGACGQLRNSYLNRDGGENH